MNKKPTVIDFFCGAGGFSEGFRQRGFDIIMGVDNWQPALETYNSNFKLRCEPKNVLDFGSLKEIENLPDSNIIVGSPPCVLFSMSNRSGNANKELGVKLIETYLRVVAFKKYKPGSILDAWLMENVPNSQKYIKPFYTFNDLDLGSFARQIGRHPYGVALRIKENSRVLNAADYGSPQVRKRFICGEIVKTNKFPDPEVTSTRRITLGEIKSKMPIPIQQHYNTRFCDPNYPMIVLPASSITDHFYDSGVYEIDWKLAKDTKTNHPFMGRMSFPEDESRPSRTVMATRSFRSRESMLFKSEYKRKGDGEYRTPTVREIATLMGFPYTYQFAGSENVKWTQVGNAVCPHMIYAIANVIGKTMGLKQPRLGRNICPPTPLDNLNTFSEKIFNDPPRRKPNARFRGHPFKGGNITVALTNFNPLSEREEKQIAKKWYCSVYQGTGKGFKITQLTGGQHKKIYEIIQREVPSLGINFIDEFEREFKYAFGKSNKFQDAYVTAHKVDNRLNPHDLMERLTTFISKHIEDGHWTNINKRIIKKEKIPTKQLYAMYALNRIIS